MEVKLGKLEIQLLPLHTSKEPLVPPLATEPTLRTSSLGQPFHYMDESMVYPKLHKLKAAGEAGLVTPVPTSCNIPSDLAAAIRGIPQFAFR